MSTLSGLNVDNCGKSRAGIAEMWVANSADIDALTFDTDHQVTAATMVATKLFYYYSFEKGTAFLNQEKTKNGNSTNVAITLSFVFPSLDNAARKELFALNECCSLVAIVKDNSGKKHFIGISHDPTDDSYVFEQMKTGEGSANTGADPTADKAEFIETLTHNAIFYAPQCIIADAAITVA
jgi:hypothetical protein